MAAEVASNQQAAAVTAAAPTEDAPPPAVAETVAAAASPAIVEVTVTKDEQKTVDAVAAAAKPVEGGDAPAPAAKVVAPKVTVHKADFEKDIIYLYQFSRTPLLPSLSPYCLKVETWLRLAGLKYEVSCFFFIGKIRLLFAQAFERKMIKFICALAHLWLATSPPPPPPFLIAYLFVILKSVCLNCNL